jgi:hypothetical protein
MQDFYDLPAWACALAFAAATLGVGVVDYHELDAARAWRASQARIDDILAQAQAQDRAAAQARREAAALALCRETSGEASATWVNDTTIVCKARRGPAKRVIYASMGRVQ